MLLLHPLYHDIVTIKTKDTMCAAANDDNSDSLPSLCLSRAHTHNTRNEQPKNNNNCIGKAGRVFWAVRLRVYRKVSTLSLPFLSFCVFFINTTFLSF